MWAAVVRILRGRWVLVSDWYNLGGRHEYCRFNFKREADYFCRRANSMYRPREGASAFRVELVPRTCRDEITSVV